MVCMAAFGVGCSGREQDTSAGSAKFEVELREVGDRKIQTIKAVREITGLGLKDAKALVESAPSLMIQGLSKNKAEEVQAKLQEAGATAEIKSN